jgi:hypothetical protein
MTNPASARRAPAPETSAAVTTEPRRRRIARALPIGTALIAASLLAAAAAVDGRAAALVLAIWVAALVIVGMRLSEPPKKRMSSRSSRIVRRPVLVLAELSEEGEIGPTMTLPVVASAEAIAVLDARPRG